MTTRRAPPRLTVAQRAALAAALELAESARALLSEIDDADWPAEHEVYGRRLALFEAKSGVSFLVRKLAERIGE